MPVSLIDSRTTGLTPRDTPRPDNGDDDNSGGAAPIGITEPPRDDREAIDDPPH